MKPSDQDKKKDEKAAPKKESKPDAHLKPRLIHHGEEPKKHQPVHKVEDHLAGKKEVAKDEKKEKVVKQE